MSRPGVKAAAVMDLDKDGRNKLDRLTSSVRNSSSTLSDMPQTSGWCVLAKENVRRSCFFKIFTSAFEWMIAAVGYKRQLPVSALTAHPPFDNRSYIASVIISE